jgi:hypothetical protein
MTREELERVVDIVSEARTLSEQMRSILDALDATLDRAEAQEPEVEDA